MKNTNRFYENNIRLVNPRNPTAKLSVHEARLQATEWQKTSSDRALFRAQYLFDEFELIHRRIRELGGHLRQQDPNVHVADKDNFKEVVLNHKGLVVIDVWSYYCLPCHELAMEVKEMAKMHPEVRFISCSIDFERDNDEIERFAGYIDSIPELVFVLDGKLVDRIPECDREVEVTLSKKRKIKQCLNKGPTRDSSPKEIEKTIKRFEREK